MKIAVGVTACVCYIEVVHISEGPFIHVKVLLYLQTITCNYNIIDVICFSSLKTIKFIHLAIWPKKR